MNQITNTNARNYDPALMTGFKVATNDIGAYFKNAVLGPTGFGTGVNGTYSIGTASGFAVLSGVNGTAVTTVTASGLTITTGNTGETAGTGSGFSAISYTTGSDTGANPPYTTALADANTLHAQLIALPGIDISANAAALEAYNTGLGLGVFTPGVYTTASALGVTASKTLTLSGAGDYVFISTGGAITFGATDVIVLTNGATANRVYWVANNAITTGATDTLVGNFMSGTNALITIGSTNIIQGRLISQGPITIAGTASIFSLPIGVGSSVTASTTITFPVRTQNILGVPVAPVILPLLNTALGMDGLNIAGNLAINSCRMYTYLAKVNSTTGAVTMSVVAGNDFPKSRPVNVTTDVNLSDGSFAIVGYLYVKNESAAVFVPNTTNLGATGITSIYGDGFGFMSYNALS